MNTMYDPYASPNDPAYSPVTGPDPAAEIEQLKAIGYTDAQIRAMQRTQANIPNYSADRSTPSWAQQQSAAQQAASLAEQRRQFDETQAMSRARGDQQMQLEQATQKWKEAVDARDFQAAEYWKARSQELQQNQLALQYTNLLASKSGPQDWIKYARLSRGESPLLNDPNGQTIPLDQALPAWARGFAPGTYPNSSGAAPGPFGGAAGPAAGPAAGGAAPAAPVGGVPPLAGARSAPVTNDPTGHVVIGGASGPGTYETPGGSVAPGQKSLTTISGAGGLPISIYGPSPISLSADEQQRLRSA